MRFMVMHKMTPELEQGLPPDPEVLAGVEKLISDAASKNIFQGGEGLKPTKHRTHITYKNGKRTIVDGPFTETKELIGGFALLAVKSKEEALAWCDKFAEVAGDVELHLGAVVEYWDMGFGEKPKDAPMRFLSLTMADPNNESTGPDAKMVEKMGALVDAMTKAGVLQATGGLAPTSLGARIRFDKGKHTITDGPFAESKELISGYAILELPSKEEAVAWAVRFGEIVKVHEVDVRPMM